MCLNQQIAIFKTKLCTDYKVRYCCLANSIGKPTIPTMPPVVVTTTPTTANTCGRQAITPSYQRIVGGVEAVAHSWPWIVSLQSRDHFCGGTLIDNRHVLTAAHCIDSSTFRVIAGLHQRTNINGPRSQNVGVSRIFIHEQYNTRTEANDIALIRLAQPVQFNAYVSPICLPGPDPQESARVTVAGWGLLSEGGNSATSLRQVTLNVMNNQAQRAYGNEFDVRRQIGAGIPNIGGKDSCQGDSGGPLMYNSNNQWYLSGVVSFGEGCGSANYPGVYTRTSAYLSWIQSKINTP
jgi:secreted trypsin-like serine protease